MLGAGKTFPDLIKEDAIMSGSVARDVCAQVNQDLVKIVPQFEDYACPICTEVTYRPVRMKCGHVFCLTCACEMQHNKTKPCPVCRAPVILVADSDNLDKELGKLIKKNFPREWREAGIAQQTEDGLKQFGPSYKHPKAGKEWKEPGCRFM
jgi:E3 ubiquitin-protein ligase BAH